MINKLFDEIFPIPMVTTWIIPTNIEVFPLLETQRPNHIRYEILKERLTIQEWKAQYGEVYTCSENKIDIIPNLIFDENLSENWFLIRLPKMLPLSAFDAIIGFFVHHTYIDIKHWNRKRLVNV